MLRSCPIVPRCLPGKCCNQLLRFFLKHKRHFPIRHCSCILLVEFHDCHATFHYHNNHSCTHTKSAKAPRGLNQPWVGLQLTRWHSTAWWIWIGLVLLYVLWSYKVNMVLQLSTSTFMVHAWNVGQS